MELRVLGLLLFLVDGYLDEELVTIPEQGTDDAVLLCRGASAAMGSVSLRPDWSMRLLSLETSPMCPSDPRVGESPRVWAAFSANL
jgi:hypothetical protein